MMKEQGHTHTHTHTHTLTYSTCPCLCVYTVHNHTHTYTVAFINAILLQVPIVATLPVATVMSWHDEMGLLLVAVSGDQNIHIWNVKD